MSVESMNCDTFLFLLVVGGFLKLSRWLVRDVSCACESSISYMHEKLTAANNLLINKNNVDITMTPD